MRQLAAAVLVSAVAVMGACNDGDENAKSNDDGAAAAKSLEHYTQKAQVRLSGSGPAPLDYQGEGELRVLRTRGQASMRTIGTAQPLKLPNGWNVDVFGTANSDGDGRYEVKPGVAPSGQQIASTIYANVFKGDLGSATQGGRYDKLNEACSIEISKGGDEGKMSCKRLGAFTGSGEVSFEFSWTATGPKVEVPMEVSGSTTSTSRLTGAP